MIRTAEIQQIANREGIRDTQIEKDYILSWILAGIAHHEMLSQQLIFKGGTVLKKFYFADYRYSEDLDFTLLQPDVTNDNLMTALNDVQRYVKNEANINLSILNLDEHTTGNINFFINYSGPLGGTNKDKQVKMDISRSELLKFDPEERQMIRKYSDEQTCSLKCYSLNEIMTEKMRSLLSRQQPRDYYDLWYLSEYAGLEMADYVAEFAEKSKYKHLNSNDLELRIVRLTPVFRAQWESSMQRQIKELPPFEQVARELGRHIRKLSAQLQPIKRKGIRM